MVVFGLIVNYFRWGKVRDRRASEERLASMRRGALVEVFNRWLMIIFLLVAVDNINNDGCGWGSSFIWFDWIARVGNEGGKERAKTNPKTEKPAGHNCGATKEFHKSPQGHHLCGKSPQEHPTVGTNGFKSHQHANGNRVKKVEFASQLQAEGGKRWQRWPIAFDDIFHWRSRGKHSHQSYSSWKASAKNNWGEKWFRLTLPALFDHLVFTCWSLRPKHQHEKKSRSGQEDPYEVTCRGACSTTGE